MSLKFSWRDELVNTALFFAFIGTISLFFQQITVVFSLGLLLYLGWHIRNATYLLKWLAEGMPSGQTPDLNGIWAELQRYTCALRNRSQKQKRKTSRFLRRFQEAAAALPYAAIILGRRDEIEWCNPASQELFGLDPNHATGNCFTHLVRQPDLTQYLQGTSHAQSIEITSPIDESRILSCQMRYIGKKHKRLLIVRDVTQSYLIDQIRKDFVANVSHELRTPLTVLRGFLETLNDATDECPAWARSMEVMLQQTARMERIVNDLLILSRLEFGGDGGPGNEPVPVPELLTNIVQDAKVLSGENSHEFILEIEPNLWLLGSAEELRGAFSNLVYNAVQHTPEKSKIHITWRSTEEKAILIVADNGEGIPACHLPRLTERFYRVDKARSRARGGTGLGLAIVKHVITRHGGELKVTSELGKGSTFTCSLPTRTIYYQIW